MSILDFPEHLLMRFVENMDAEAFAIASSLNKQFQKVCKEVAAPHGPSMYDMTIAILESALFRPTEYYTQGKKSCFLRKPSVHVCLSDVRGRTLCWVTRRTFEKVPFYKLDDSELSPNFNLNSKQLPVFEGFIRNNIYNIHSVSIYSDLPFLSKPIQSLSNRFEGVFPFRYAKVFDVAYMVF
jgi:hypothetical protein